MKGRWLKILSAINLNTLYVNFRFFDFKEACHFPILISNSVSVKLAHSASIRIDCDQVRPGMIKIGFGHVDIFNFRRSTLRVDGSLTFCGRAYLGYGTNISVSSSGKLVLGDNFRVSTSSSIVCHKRIEIGREVLISWDVLIMDSDLHRIYNADLERINREEKVVIGDNVWVGARCLILKGTIISNGCVLAAGNVFSNSKEGITNSVLTGNRIVRENISWEE